MLAHLIIYRNFVEYYKIFYVSRIAYRCLVSFAIKIASREGRQVRNGVRIATTWKDHLGPIVPIQNDRRISLLLCRWYLMRDDACARSSVGLQVSHVFHASLKRTALRRLYARLSEGGDVPVEPSQPSVWEEHPPSPSASSRSHNTQQQIYHCGYLIPYYGAFSTVPRSASFYHLQFPCPPK